MWPDAPGKRLLRDPAEILLCQCAAITDGVVEAQLEKEKCPRALPRYRNGAVARVVPNEDGLTWVEINLSEPISFLAGQFVLIAAPGVDGYRAYSPAECGREVSRISLVVRNKPEGMLSPLLCSPSSVGLPLQVFGPLGAAHVRPQEDEDLAIVVGGSGAAVALSLLDWAESTGHLEQHRIDVVCGLRTQRCPEITRRLSAIAGRNPDQLRVVLALSDEDGDFAHVPSAHFGLRLERGMAHEVAARCHEGAWRDRSVFVAGPPPMVQGTLRALVGRARLSPSRIRYDSFS